MWEKIHYRNVYEDGSDWLGHQRGLSKSYTIGYECTCDNIKFKKMCLNCSFYQVDTCINKSVIEKYKNTIETLDSPFSVEKISITVKNRLMPVIVGKLILKLFQEFLSKQFKTYLL